MADQTIIIKIPKQVVKVPKTVNAPVRKAAKVIVSLEPANDGVVTIENQGDGVFISFKKKPFETEIITPPSIDSPSGT